MTRDFIFDAAGAVIGYRCRIASHYYCEPEDGEEGHRCNPCNRLFTTARGLWQHQRRAHGHQEQLSLYPAPGLNRKAKGAKKRRKAMDSPTASGLVSSSA